MVGKPVGVYYFPGWSTPGGGANPADPWAVIPKHRLPLRGAYDETLQAVCDAQLTEMAQFGIDFVAVDVYWLSGGAAYLRHWIDNYIASTVPNKPALALLWANGPNLNAADWLDCYTYWIDNYLNDPNVFTVDGKPLVVIFNPAEFRNGIGGGTDLGARTQLDDARAANGRDGIAFYANTYLDNDVTDMGSGPGSAYAMGFDGLTAYQLVLAPGYRWKTLMTHYARWFSRALVSPLPCILPITAGWDNRRWTSLELPNPETDIGYTANPDHREFALHLESVRFWSRNSSRVKGSVIGAWNEHGEGSILEPTRYNGGTDRLQSVQDILKSV